jgi:hypothetical protein
MAPAYDSIKIAHGRSAFHARHLKSSRTTYNLHLTGIGKLYRREVLHSEEGFGESNFKALLYTQENDQFKRGVLISGDSA